MSSLARMVPIPLLAAALALLALPPILIALGLTITSATEVVVFAIACMALNILIGQTGLVSFGHGAWFGLAAYVAAIVQRELFPNAFLLPVAIGLIAVMIASTVFGLLILRRRGVYFSLLTLALSAMLYVIAFRWTEVTGGENGLGGIVRPNMLGWDLDRSDSYYWFVAGIALVIVALLWRFHQSPVGTVLVAIRENEQRARFLGYATNRYKLLAFVLSATLTGLAGILLLYKNRMTSADPVSVAFSGDLLAMVVIGGMRSFLGPALGALFFILFREFLSIYTENWQFWFGLVFVGFIVFSPSGLTGVFGRLVAPFRRTPVEDAAMAGRRTEEMPLPRFLVPERIDEDRILSARGIVRAFGGIKAVDGVDIEVRDRTLHALIGPNGAGKTTAFNLLSGLHKPDRGEVSFMGRAVAGLAPEDIARAGIGRSFQITNLFPTLSVRENIRLAVQARDPHRYSVWMPAGQSAETNARTDEIMRYLGLAGIENAEAGSLSYGGQRLLDMGLALATAPRILLLDEPLAGLAAAERKRIGDIIKRISADVPVLLVEHDIDRVFELADRVTVMNEGRVLLDGTVDDARSSSKVQEVYIGSGAASIAAKHRETAATPQVLLEVSNIDTFYGKSHIIDRCSLVLHQHEIIALLGRNGAGKVDAAEDADGHCPGRPRLDQAGWQAIGRTALGGDRPRRHRLRPTGPRAVCRHERRAEPRTRPHATPDGQRHPLEPGADLRVFPTARRTARQSCGFPVRRRTADACRGARPFRRHQGAAARRTVRGAGPGDRRATIRDVRQAARTSRHRHRRSSSRSRSGALRHDGRSRARPRDPLRAVDRLARRSRSSSQGSLVVKVVR